MPRIDIRPQRQGDMRWALEQMFPSQLLFGKWGCLATCLDMAIQNCQIDITPKEFNTLMVAEHCYMTSGDLSWPAFDKAFTQVIFRDRLYVNRGGSNLAYTYTPEAAMGKVNKLIKNGLAVPILIDAMGNDGVPDHWVLLIEHTSAGFHHYIDPATGTEETHGPGELEEKMYGWAIVLMQPTLYSEDCDADKALAAYNFLKSREAPDLAHLGSEAVDILLTG